MMRRGRWLVPLLLLGWDIFSLRVGFEWIVTDLMAPMENPWVAAYIVILFGMLAVDGAYTYNAAISRVDETFRVGRAAIVATLCLLLAGAVGQLRLPIGPRGFVKLSLVFTALSIPFRWIVRTIQKKLLRFRIGTRRTLLVGAADRARVIAGEIAAKPELGYEVVGYVGAGEDLGIAGIPSMAGDAGTIPGQIKMTRSDEVILTHDTFQHELIPDLITTINGSPVIIQILPDMSETVTGLGRTETIYGLPLIRVNPDIMTPWIAATKRIGDLLTASAVLMLTFPLLLVIGLLVRLGSAGPAIFSQERVGYRGRHFTIHKFRTMYNNAEENSGPVWATPDDPRITPLGRFLRRFRLDELPQMWNILNGDMSFVGPRPERPHFVDLLKGEFAFYHRRLLVRPGLTGWAQIRGNYDNSLDDVGSKLRHDLYYIENLSIRLDLKILLLTVKVMLSGKGQ
ncbi:MAG: sugar transferase [Candidatus Marinimicrobia bacterium]|nr:sugar transferase [Candidatus Neomarinimicrobiota bacterium]